MRIKELEGFYFFDEKTEPEDTALGHELASTIGDLLMGLDRNEPLMGTTPFDLWEQVAKALRVHGLKIVEAGPEESQARKEFREAMRAILLLPVSEALPRAREFIKAARLNGTVQTLMLMPEWVEFCKTHKEEILR